VDRAVVSACCEVVYFINGTEKTDTSVYLLYS